MASYVKYFQFVEDMAGKVHDLFGTAGATADTLKVVLSNTAGDVAQTLATLSQITEIAAGNGYSTGGQSVQNVGVRASGTMTVTCSTVTFTASGGTIGPFRYAIVYNDTPTSPADPLICSFDYGSALTLQNGESFVIRWNSNPTSGTLFTLA